MWKIMKENLEDLLSPNLWRSLACETVGTLVIVLLGCGAWIQWVQGGINVVQIALAFGLSVATMVWSFAHISGGHFNPALTAATLVTRRVSIIRGVLYIIAQVLGGILGAGVLYGLTPESMRGDLGATVIAGADVTAAQAFGVEMLITFIFVLSFFASRDSARSDLAGSYPLTVGLAVVVCQLFAVSHFRLHFFLASSPFHPCNLELCSIFLSTLFVCFLFFVDTNFEFKLYCSFRLSQYFVTGIFVSFPMLNILS